ncbi:carbohydrate binding family 9 domain-containing protein [Muricauda sp. SCSIO 64092]|uniref:carbohydrate binding family 9 domain-containing protein n=1 Tax=Allomuricauda sp. SCSIO 64092 TaxID=2908842 RepID=UPI001FF5CC18|nr:carbohydrate binding family 9 domain-containing protein [Muricauda sp. SCSIO 64092]UOY06349.1 carbohydrate binding family 9 domain-containing protein [Muricauda sp. SCSIO 64092]
MKGAFFFIFLLIGVCIRAQEKETDNFPPPETPVTIRAFKTIGVITIDGRLDESDWDGAEPITNFFRVEPVQGDTIKNPTEVRILYDDKNLYFGVFARDSLGKKGIRMQDLSRDFNGLENDVFGIQIDAQNTKQYAVSFQTTPYGNQQDVQNFNDNNRDEDWNALWRVRTQRTDKGYYAEFAIPFKSIRYDKPMEGVPVEWGITFFRLARKDFEKTVFPAIPQSFSENRMIYAAKLTGLEVPPPSANIRIEPYALYQYDENKEGSVLTDRLNEPKVGGDVKWAISPNAVLDLTINTDFAQADVDRAVNNLERFNIFFPERRQFFLENSGIWAGGGNSRVRPFFSRTIGLSNAFNAAPAPLDAGVRYTDRNENRTIAALAVRQRETDDSPGSTFGVARYTQNYGKENNIGAMVTYRLDDSFGDLGLENQNNTTISVDGLIRPKPDITLTYLLSTSLDSETGDTGFAGRLVATSTTNKYYLGYISDIVSADYTPGMGFVFQKDVVLHSPGGYAIVRPKWLPFVRRWDPGVFFNYFHDFEDFGNFQQSNLYIFPIYTWFKDNSFLEASFTPTWQNINFDFAPLGLEIEEGDYSYTRYLVRYNSDRSKKLSGSIRFDFGNFYNGTRNTVIAGLRYAPLPHVSLTADYEHNNINGVGMLSEDLNTDLYTGSLRLALNPRVQLSTFYQYNSFDEQGRWNIRFSWEYMPLSFIYIVFNDTQTDMFDPVQRSTQTISKVTFLKQF